MEYCSVFARIYTLCSKSDIVLSLILKVMLTVLFYLGSAYFFESLDSKYICLYSRCKWDFKD